MEPSLFKALIDRYRNGTATSFEKELVEGWLKEQEQRPLPLHEVDERRIKTEMLFAIRRQLRSARMGKLRRLVRAGAAAVLIAGLALFGWYLWPSQETLPTLRITQTGAGERKQIVLPDHSVIWLNANSRVEYPENFSSGERTVHLVQGEAFFEVTPDTSKPFTVRTDWFDTRVLGTSFNVQVHPETAEVGVAVETGKVEVRPTDTASAQQVFRLTRGQGVLYNKEAKAMSYTTGSETPGIWRSGGLSFAQRSLKDVVRALEDKYATTIVLEVDERRDYRFTATITPQTSLDEVLSSVCLVNKLIRVDQDGLIVLRERAF
ncbi:FecR domain-containing protein [Parapedobacter sp. ISTM3]|uniref:FecR family protein n=1 Tax=Parapedobacter luteus TaxID=623280 RepID=A0A1T5ELX5_9SPHI|nr:MULTISPECIES: FecR family protein [Parapedobacter]MBK1441313.1 FecR domain-containing protein [Parapedobacter sp. ISTM3]SKB84957.1 FecR family protein [Parapedobacter luteus]